MADVIKVGMAEYKTTDSDNILTTLGLGSCIGICITDPRTKISGLAHIMLPSSKNIKNNKNKAKFADTAIPEMIKEMERRGARKRNMISKIAGGAQMFKFSSSNSSMNVGLRNAEAVRMELKRLKIPIISEDCGGNYGRTIRFFSENAELEIKTIGHGLKKI